MTFLPFNKPYFTGKETHYIQDAVREGKLSGNGKYTKLSHAFFAERYAFKRCLLTTSCTDALEMAAILCEVGPGDEVIVPSYTFVSTANAFVMRGAKIVFADSSADHPGLDEDKLESLITPRTKVIVPVHYAGMACDMDKIMALAKKYNLLVVEDAAQAIDGFYKGRPLGGIGHLAAFSFHESKNIISGEGGMLVVNDDRFWKRAEIIWEKGTNRAAFFKGEVDKYCWVDIGSSFLPSEITAAFLFSQLENLPEIQKKRIALWNKYQNGLQTLEGPGRIKIPRLPEFASNNGHMYYLTVETGQVRDKLIHYLVEKGIDSVFHYVSLHSSPYFISKHDGRELPRSDFYRDCLVRLPLFYELTDQDQDRVISAIRSFFGAS